MEPFRYHVFVCDQRKPEGVPSCACKGSTAVLEALRKEIATQGLMDEVQLTTCGSLGLCDTGPNMIVYPEGVWYSGVSAADISEIVRSHFMEGNPVERLVCAEPAELRAQILSSRAKFLAAGRAREVSGMLPDEILQTLRSFQESRALLTAIELDLFAAVGDGADAAAVASSLDTDRRATEMLLNVMASLGLLSKDSGVYGNTPISARYFVPKSREYARPGLMHTIHLWNRWSTLTDCVRQGAAVAGDDISARGEIWTQAFIAAMDRNAAERAPHVVRAVGTMGVRRMLDVGGGSGAYSIAFAKASPDLKAEILDLETVLSITQTHIEAAGMTARISTQPGDLRRDPLGEGFDLVFVSQICHMLDEAENLDLIRRCLNATAAGGKTVIQDFILEPDKTAPKSATLFALNMLVGTRSGSTYSSEEYFGWMKAAGFREVKHVRLPGPSGLIIGTR